MTNEEMQSTADIIAKEDPSILLKALRDNGFWMYAINTVDVEEAISDSPNADLAPITNKDFEYVNYWDRVADEVNYEDVMNSIVMQIRNRRNAQANAQ